VAGWPTKRLDNLCEVTSSKRVYAKDLTSSGVPFLRSKEIIEKLRGQEQPANPLFISEEHFQRILADFGAPMKGDLLLTSRGTLGVPYIVNASDRFHFADGNLTWFRKFQGLNSHFLKYFFLSPLGEAELKKCVIGSSQQAYTISALKSIAIPLPPFPRQYRIASVLSAYDDLIENNTRRIKILEEMAQLIYREWFVHFRFPGRENVRMVESELGPIPEGWSAPALEQILEYNIGGGWGEEQKSDEFYIPAYVMRGTDIPGARYGSVGNCPLRWHKESNFRSRKLQAGDFVFEVSGGSKGQPVGRSLVVSETLLSQFDRD
jgi:type I restriction enzyme, S subunit